MGNIKKMVNIYTLALGGYDLPVMVIDLKSRSIISVPTQIGCAIGCTFCISSLTKFVRNLNNNELTKLVEFGIGKSKNAVNMISFTGEGEPFLNLKNINSSIESMGNHNKIERYRICTSGIRPNLLSAVVSNFKPINLQLSLHSPFNEKRRELVPNTKDVADILTGIRDSEDIFDEIAVNYVLMSGYNDSDGDLCELKRIINDNWIIKLNPLLDDILYSPSLRGDYFYNELISSGQSVKKFNKVGSTIKNNLYNKLSHEKHNSNLIV